MRTVGDVRNGANAIYSGAAKSLPAITISLRAPSNRPLAGRDGSQHGATDRNGEAERRNARQASHLALSASETAQRGAKWWITWCRLCAISPPVRRKRRYYQRN